MKNQKGFTIVELLIGMTILSIVAVALTGFIVSSSKSYAASNTEIMVQQESQLAMNQMSDVIIDTTRSVNYVGYSLDGSVSEQVVKDADFTIDVEDKCLVLYNGEGTVVVDASGNPVLDADGNPEIAKDADGKPIVTGGNGNKNYQIYWDKSEEKLFYSEIDISETDFPESDRVLLAEYVKDFSVDLSQVEEKRVVKLTLSYGYNNKVYETSNNITIRNKVLVNSVNLAVNKSVELNIRVKENVVVLEPNEEYRFSTPIIEGRNILDKSVTWSISAEAGSAPSDAGTKLTDINNGILKISDAEKAVSFKVTVTTNAVDSAGNHASADVEVRVKRVTSLNLYKSWDEANDNGASNGADEISPGYKFTISANVSGNWLGVTCDHCGDDITIDRYLVPGRNLSGWSGRGWEIWDPEVYNDPIKEWWHPTEYLEMLSHDEHSATFYLKPNTPDDGTFGFVIGAMSLLSVTDNTEYGRHYDNYVAERIGLKTKKPQGDLTTGGDFRYGDEPLTLIWDYPNAYALVCVRIKNLDKAEPEKIVVYNTDGHEIRVGADLFGLDLNCNYSLSMQVLDKKLENGGSTIDHAGFHENCTGECKDFINNEYLQNCDNTGAYNGSVKASSMITVMLNKPQLTIRYNSTDYVGKEVNIGDICALKGSVEIPCNITAVSSTRAEGERVLNDAKADVYLNGEKLYYYNVDSNSYVGNNARGTLSFSNCLVHNGKQMKVKLSEGDGVVNAVGSYSFVPFFSYSNAKDASRYKVHYFSYKPDYDMHYYYRPESKINFTVTGGNMTLIAHDGNNLCEGDTFFPIPSDTSQGGFTKYFNLKDTSLQHAKEEVKIKLYTKGGNKDIGFSDVTCEYIASDNDYRIELFYTYYDQTFARNIKVSAGTFKCAADGSKWERERFGTLDGLYRDGTTQPRGIGNARIRIKQNDESEKTFDTYIPMPSDSDFGNYLGLDLNAIKATDDFYNSNYGEVTVKYKNGDNGQDIRFGRIKCRYDKNTKTYTLVVTCASDQNFFNNPDKSTVLTLTCVEGDRSWTLVN